MDSRGAACGKFPEGNLSVGESLSLRHSPTDFLVNISLSDSPTLHITLHTSHLRSFGIANMLRRDSKTAGCLRTGEARSMLRSAQVTSAQGTSGEIQ